jgi:hypothetical protein
MSGRFDGNHSTIGHTPKYTPAHDCPTEALKNAQRFGKSRAGQPPARVGIPRCSSSLRGRRPLNPMPSRHCFFGRIRSHAATRLDGEHRRVRGRIASPNARAGQATFRVCA